MKTRKLVFSTMLLFVAAFTACKKDNEVVVKEGIQRAELIFTEATGGVHGNHFDDLVDGTDVTPIVVKFDETGKATSGGHLHLEADAIYKVELKAWDHTGKEVQNDFISTKAVADNYKAFIIGGNFILNSATSDDSGAIFQPREQSYADGTTFTASGGLETTGIVSYFTVGHSNEGELNVSYVLRKLNPGVKSNITRNDWNRSDYATAFGGEDLLRLKFEIHSEDH